jgi:allophanate hydrolase subunit 1
MVITASSLRVSVPVLSEQRISILPASSTAERLVGKTPRRANARAPTAAASVNIEGKATGIDERTATRMSGTMSARGIGSHSA